LVGLQPLDVLAVAGDARVYAFEVGVDGVLERHPAVTHGLYRLVDVAGSQRHVLDALALVVLEEFLNLRVLVLALVQRDADLAVRSGRRGGGSSRRSPRSPGCSAPSVRPAR